MIEINNFKKSRLVDIKKCNIDKGIYKLSGANGSGKTTLLEYISGFRKDNALVTDIASKQTLFLGETGIGTEDLTILENIQLAYWSFGIKLSDSILFKINKCYTEQQLNTLYKRASFGMQIMVGLSLLFSENQWQLIILDETLSGVDKENTAFFFECLQQLKKETTIIIVSHSEISDIDYQEIYIENGELYYAKNK